MLGLRDRRLVRRMKQHGIVNPVWTLQAARKTHLPLALACALLVQETGGGRNVFGHDPTIFIGAGEVTKDQYLAYKAIRGPAGIGGMQGVGPMQLTWWSFQDAADAIGGCWDPRCNMEIGFAHACALIRRNGLRLGVRAYNGSGPAAERYANTVLALHAKWTAILNLPFTAGPVVKRPKPKRIVLNPRNWWQRWVFGDTDCDRRLLCALANVAKRYGTGHRVYVRCGTRTFAEQSALYAKYLRDGHPLTARPGTSNHEVHPPAKTGQAADCQLVDAFGHQVNIGEDRRARSHMRRHGLCLPVPGETWHVERGTAWRA